MKKERKELEVSLLDLNTGQIDWLPANPRQWTREDLDKTTESVKRDPDFLEDRPILVLPIEKGRYCVFAGNLRSSACLEAKRKTAPCIIYQVENDEDHETVKRRAILDNGSFGAWDFDALANEWDDLPLGDWGVPAWGTEEEEESQKPTEMLSGLEYEPLYYQPKNIPNLKLKDCANFDKFNKKLEALNEFALTDEQKETLKIFAYRFIKIDFEAVANYYSFNASDEEKKAMERLRLVLIDDGQIGGFIEDDLLKISEATDNFE